MSRDRGQGDDANPAARLAGPETSHHALANGYLAWALVKIGWYLQPTDVVTVHWYPDGPPLQSYMQSVRDLMYQYTAASEVWLTETGMDTCNDDYQATWYGAVFSAFQQEGRSYWTKVFPYVLHNGNYSCGEHIVRSDWTNRPAFDQYRNWIISWP